MNYFHIYVYICFFLQCFLKICLILFVFWFFVRGKGGFLSFVFFRLCSTKLFVFFFLNNFLYILVVCILDINTKQIHITYFINVCICNVVSMFSFFCLNFLLQFLIFSFFFAFLVPNFFSFFFKIILIVVVVCFFF